MVNCTKIAAKFLSNLAIITTRAVGEDYAKMC
jgi:hypothetical protein